jgi:type II secretory pathway pseudopilin PulG
MVARTRRSAGFSLAEALVALAIAVLLTAVLTRVVSNTRMSAAKIRELVEMMTLSDKLLEQVSQQLPETTNGHTGHFAWHIGVTPTTMTAIARKVNPKIPSNDQPGTKTAGLTSAPEFAGTSIAAGQAATPKSDDGPKWIPFHVTILVESSSGRKYVTDTVSIGPEPAKEPAKE